MKAITAKLPYLPGYIIFYKKYPLSLFLKLIYVPIQMLLSVFLWISLSKSGSDIDLEYMIIYYLLCNLLLYSYPFASIAKDIRQEVISGSIYNIMVRPVSLINKYYSKYIAWMLIYSAVYVPVILYMTVFRNVSILEVLLFILFWIIGMSIEFLIWYLVGVLSFIFGNIKGFISFTLAIRLFLSGAILPLTFYPKVFNQIATYSPFRFFIFTPINYILGSGYNTVPVDIAISISWIVFLFVFIKIISSIGLRKLQTN